MRTMPADQAELNKNFQRRLQVLGLYRGAIDGILGQGTSSAWEIRASVRRLGDVCAFSILEIIAADNPASPPPIMTTRLMRAHRLS